MNNLYIPILNPVNFYEITPVELPQYLSRPMGDYEFTKTIKPWEDQVHYCQKFQTSDITKLQFISNFDPIQVEVIDQYGQTVLTQAALQKLQNKYQPGYFAYESSISWATFANGNYWIRLNAGAGSALLISEPILISQTHENTLYLTYKNSRYHADVIFETGIEFNFRVEASLGRINPSSNDQFYDDQRLNPTVLSSKPFDSFPLIFGGSYGLPDWVIQKINYIFSCNSVKLDGREFSKTSDSKYSYNTQEQYPMRGMAFEVRPGINRGSKIISPSVNPNLRMIVVHNISGRVFGDLSEQASSNVIVINSIE